MGACCCVFSHTVSGVFTVRCVKRCLRQETQQLQWVFDAMLTGDEGQSCEQFHTLRSQVSFLTFHLTKLFTVWTENRTKAKALHGHLKASMILFSLFKIQFIDHFIYWPLHCFGFVLEMLSCFYALKCIKNDEWRTSWILRTSHADHICTSTTWLKLFQSVTTVLQWILPSLSF